MLPVEFFHKTAEQFPLYDAAAWVFTAGAVLTLIFGVIRLKKGFLRYLPAVLYAAAASILFVFSSNEALSIPLAVLAGLTLIVHLIIQKVSRNPAPSPEPLLDLEKGTGEKESIEKRRLLVSRIYLGVALFLAAVILFYHLGSYVETLLVWESPVSQEFGRAFLSGQGIVDYALHRFLWDDGLMSTGHKSLFYGAPTYALFKIAGFNTWNLRFIAAILALLSVAVAYLLGRRFLSARIGNAFALLLALNSSVLFYGRYGTLASATLLGALLAIYGVWLFLNEEKPRWWMVLLCGLCLYLATLQYATARLLVLILLAMIPLVVAVEWRRFNRHRLIGLILLLLCVGGVWWLQAAHDTARFYHRARGEQFFHFLESSYYYKEFTGREINPNLATRKDKFDLLYGVLDRTIPQYWWFLKPTTDHHVRGFLDSDPPRIPLYFAPWIVFILWGLGHSLFQLRSWKHALFVIWVVLATGPLLLTNRVDAHRIMLFVIPFSMWAAMGVAQGAAIMTKSGVPRWMMHILAGVLIVLMFWNNITLLFYPKPKEPEDCRYIVKEMNEIEGPVQAALKLDHRKVSWINLAMLERTRRDSSRKATLMEDRLLHGLSQSQLRGRNVPRALIYQVESLLPRVSLILAPSGQYRALSEALVRKGYEVLHRFDKGISFFVVPRGKPGKPAAAMTGVRVQTQESLPEWKGEKIYLDQLKPVDVRHGFKPPAMKTSWNGGPIRMNSTTYDHGIGVHSWCEVTFEVPPKAVAFESIIGFSDQVRGHPDAEVTFEVVDEKGNTLYSSGIITPADRPVPIRLELKGAGKITLVVTEGRDGRDNDHANWADAAFLLEP
jgi:4-amino-4-deoxy-L-arabinose transferase-like glycosyltransferase